MKKLTRFVYEQIYLIFYIVVIGVGLIFSVLILANTLGKAPAINDISKPSEANSLDQSAIDALTSLNTSDNVDKPATLPGGRINPFSE